jgi:hypothetical protein
MLTHSADLSSRPGVEAQPPVPQPVYPPRRWPWVVAAIVAVAVAGFLVWFFAFRDTGGTETASGSSEVTGPADVRGPDETPFTLSLPSGWKALSQEGLSQLPGSPVAVMQQTEGAGVLIINTQPPSNAPVAAVGKKVEAKLRQSVPDFRLVGAGPFNLEAGQAFQISYARTKAGTANTLVVVPAGGRIYTLNSVVPGGDQDAVKQAIDMIKSFNA